MVEDLKMKLHAKYLQSIAYGFSQEDFQRSNIEHIIWTNLGEVFKTTQHAKYFSSKANDVRQSFIIFHYGLVGDFVKVKSWQCIMHNGQRAIQKKESTN